MESTPAHTLTPADLDQGWTLLSLGRSICPACQVAGSALPIFERAWPDLRAIEVTFDTPEDWAVRETLLWPRGIRVSRATVPVTVLLNDGVVVATRPGAIPAFATGEWLIPHLGAADLPEALTPEEQAVLNRTSTRRAQHSAVTSRD